MSDVKMNEALARKIFINLRNQWNGADVFSIRYDDTACFSEEVDFTLNQLKAIVWWMENMGEWDE